MRLALLLGLLAASAPAQERVRPNVVLFLVDDMGWQDTSVAFHTEPTAFNRRYRTPHMERLAAAGMRFTNAYASAPVCTPTRTSILTGKSPGQSRITWWILNKDKDTSKRHPKLAPPKWNVNGLQKGDVTLARLLRAAGYRTIHVGKAHFGAHGTSGGDPKNLGFDVNVAGHASGGPASYYGKHHFTVAGRQGKDPKSSRSVWDIPGLEKYHGQDIYLTEALAREATAAVRQAVADKRPFFLHFAPYAVHAPIMANRKHLEKYEGLHPREAAYATMIETMDAALGATLRVLDELGVADNTVVLFSSDNGGLSAHARGGKPHTHNAPLRSGKGSAYEGGTRVPTIVRWPGVVRAGAVEETPIISHDFFPTILDLAGVAMPKGHAPAVEGQDLAPLLAGKEGFDARRALFWHQPHQWGANGPGIHPFTSMRLGAMKLIYFHAGRRFELYDLAKDIGETRDLAAERPEVVRALAGRLDAWIERYSVQLSIDKQTGEPVETPGRALAGR